MYNIYDILENVDFKVVNEDLTYEIVYASDRVSAVLFSICHNDEKIFEYSPNYIERYEGSFNKEAVEVTVKDILDDLDKEIKEQIGIKYIISNAESEWINQNKG